MKNEKELPWFKVLSLLMHQFEVTEFTITEGDLEAFRREYDGRMPTVMYQERNGVMKVWLETNQRRIV